MDYGIQARVILRANGTVDLKLRGEHYSLLGSDVAEIVEVIEGHRKKREEWRRAQKDAETTEDTA